MAVIAAVASTAAAAAVAAAVAVAAGLALVVAPTVEVAGRRARVSRSDSQALRWR